MGEAGGRGTLPPMVGGDDGWIEVGEVRRRHVGENNRLGNEGYGGLTSKNGWQTVCEVAHCQTAAGGGRLQ